MALIPEIDPAQAQSLGAEGAVLLDVREDGEWAAGRATGAIHVKLGSVPDSAESLPKDLQIVAICRSGSRSMSAASFLAEQGFDVVNLAGGMRAWAEAGLPMDSDAGEPDVI
jgi:rhodanese-related sulfurtransferase